MRAIEEILKDIRPEFDYSESRDFFKDGLLDSFDLMALVSELERAFGIVIKGMDIVPENFRNLETIRSLLEKSGVRS